jgi:hypothetical protein
MAKSENNGIISENGESASAAWRHRNNMKAISA